MKTRTTNRHDLLTRLRRALAATARRTARLSCVEALEARIAPATYSPTTFADLTFTSVDPNTGIISGGTGAGQITLRSAIIAANAHTGLDTVALGAGTYQLTLLGSDNNANAGDLDINDSTTLMGAGIGATTIQMNVGAAPAGDYKVLGINQDGTHLGLTVNVSGLTITGARNNFPANGSFQETGGGVDIFMTGIGNSISFTDVRITGNTVSGNSQSYGGGVNIDSGASGLPGDTATNVFRGTVAFTRVEIDHNTADATGGGVNLFSDQHNVVFDNCNIHDNSTTATGGLGAAGGGLNIRHTNGGTITIRNNTAIANNTSHGFGGGISISAAGFQDVTIQDSSITGNTVLNNGTTSGFGGGIYNESAAGHPTTINNVLISGNHSTASGGGTEAPLGGGIANGTGVLNIGSNTSITGNTAVDGAGLFVRGGSVTMTTGSITNNLATNNGGGAAISNGGSFSLSRVTVTGNAANNDNTGGGDGGAFYVDHFIAGTAVPNGTLTVNFSRIAGNIAKTGGGGSGTTGIRNTTTGTIDATNNWWGGDALPGTGGTDSTSNSGGGAVTASPRLDLALTASPGSILEGTGSASLTADFTKNSAGTSVSLTNLSTLIGLPISFSGTLGSISGAQATIQANGMATATYIAGNATGAGSAAAQVDSTPAASASITVTEITASKTYTLVTDVDGDGQVDPGDTVRYTIVLTNPSATTATGVGFTDTPDANTNLVVGSVTATNGSISSGNTAGNTTVAMTGASINAGSTATLTFDVVVNPATVTRTISNQGTATRSVFNILTDDPAVAGVANPTVTAVDMPDVKVELLSGTSVLEDGTGTLVYTFTRQGPVSTARTVNFSVGGTAGLTGDYILSGATTYNSGAGTGTLTFSAGSATATLTMSPSDDAVVEAHETVIVTVTPEGGTALGYDVGTPAAATGTITNDDTATITFTGGGSVTEGLSGTKTVTFTATVDHAVEGGFSVSYSSEDATAHVLDGDYVGNSGSFAFAGTAGEQKTFTITVNGDNKVELDEQLNVALGGVTGTTPTQAAAISVTGGTQVVTITNDDAATVNINSVTQSEGAGNHVYTVTLSNPVDTAVTLNFSTSDGTATAGSDYTTHTNTVVTFPAGSTAGQTVTVVIADDSVVEAQETYNVTLSSLAAGGRSVSLNGGGSTLGALGTIANDDTALVMFGGAGPVDEGNSGTSTRTFTATLVGAVQGGFTLPFTVTDGTANSGSDYTVVTSSPLSFTGTNAEAHSVTVSVIGDHVVEANETFVVTLGSIGGTGATEAGAITLVGGPQIATILNDEIDFGDAPDTYGTLLASNGARHQTVLGFSLGATINGESDGQPNATATGDTGDDGVTLPGVFVTNTSASITVNASQAGKLDAFVDWNADGDFNDPGEKIFNGAAVTAGDNVLSVAVPSGATLGSTFARFRLSSAGGLGPNGLAADGEVEDYQLSIVNNQFSIDDPTITEGDSGTKTLTYTVSRTSNTQASSLDFAITGGTATAGTDYATFTGGTINFTAGGALTQTISVTINGDTLIEGNETIFMTLSNPTNGGIVKTLGTGTILDDDSATVTIAKISDGTEAGTSGKFRVTQSAVSSTDTIVTYTVGGSALNGTDYGSLSGVVTIPAGQTSADIDVTVQNDSLVEGAETVDLALSGISSSNPAITLDPIHSATISIADDDIARIRFSAATSTVSEAAGNDVLVPTLTIVPGVGSSGTAMLAHDVSFDIHASGGTATGGGVDYTLPTQLTFNAGSLNGATLNADLAITNDALVEGNETIVLGMTIATDVSGQISIATGVNGTHTTTIADNDSATLHIQSTRSLAEQGGAQTVTVTLLTSDGAGGTATLAPGVTLTADVVDAGGGSALSGTDYSAFGTQSVTFGAGSGNGATANVTLAVLNDTLVEGNESVNLLLQNLSTTLSGQASLGNTSSAVTLLDNDTATISILPIATLTEQGAVQTLAVTLITSDGAGGTATLAPGITLSADVVNTGFGSASSGIDYAPFGTQTVTFAPGSGNGAIQTVAVNVLNDNLVEGPETLALTLQNLSTTLSGQAGLGNVATAATILDNDAATIAFEFATSGVSEATALHLVGVKLTTIADGVEGAGALPHDVMVFVNDVGGGTAVGGGTDYTFTPQSVTFSAGDSGSTKTVSASIVDDAISEGNETFRLGLSTEGAIAAIAVDSTPHVVTIADNDVDVKVTVTGPSAQAVAGYGPGNLLYTVAVTNTGLTTATNLNLNELFALPAGTTFNAGVPSDGSFDGAHWLIPALASGGTAILELSFTADHSTANNAMTSASSTATSADQVLVNTGDDVGAAFATVIRQSDLAITKTDSPDPVGPGTQLTYTIVVSNTGPSDNTTAHITDVLPAGLSNVTWTAAINGGGSANLGGFGNIDETVLELAAGGSITYTVHGTVTAPANSNLANTAMVSSVEDTNSENDLATASTYVGGVDLYVSKTDGTTTTELGSKLVYTLTYGNKGFLTANGVKLTETVPVGAAFDSAGSSAGWVETSPGSGVYEMMLGSIDPMGTGSKMFAVKVNATAPAGVENIVNTASIADDHASGPDIVAGDNAVTDSDTLNASANLTVTKTADRISIARGHTLNYTITYSNTGNQDASGVELREHVPLGTFVDLGASPGWTMAEDGSGDYIFTAGVVAASAPGGPVQTGTAHFGVFVSFKSPDSIANTVTISDDGTSGPESSTDDNHASLTTPIYRGIYAVSPGVSLPGKGAPAQVRVFDIATNTEVFSISAYEGYRDSVRIAVGDLNGDGYDDIITATRTGTGRVRVFDGLTGNRFEGPLSQIDAFDGRKQRGAFVASGDVTGDGRDDIIVGSALGSVGGVKVFDGITGALVISDPVFKPSFRGGIRVAAGDLDGDGVDEIVAGQGYYGADVKVLSLTGEGENLHLDQKFTFHVGSPSYKSGVSVAVTSDMNHDGLADILVGNNRGKPTQVSAYSGVSGAAIGTPVLPFGTKYNLGVRVAAADVNFDGVADIIAGSGGLAKSSVKFFDGATHTELTDLSFAAFPQYPSGALFVAASYPVPLTTREV